MPTQLRIARPVSALDRSVDMYRKGLGLMEIGRFENHAGFDGVMLGRPDLQYHFEFTYRRAHPVVQLRHRRTCSSSTCPTQINGDRHAPRCSRLGSLRFRRSIHTGSSTEEPSRIMITIA